jgi:hypothetical protein
MENGSADGVRIPSPQRGRADQAQVEGVTVSPKKYR